MKKIITVLITLHASLFTFHSSEAQIIHVPADQPTIQAGINVSNDGDTVLVANGTYLENINFMGKAITVASNFIVDGDTNHINNTVIDGSQPDDPDYASTVTLITGEDTTSILNGLTITGGSGTLFESDDMRIGGGVLVCYSGAKLLNNKIVGNEISFTMYGGGGGIACYSPTANEWFVSRNNVITGNYCESTGLVAFSGGIYSDINTILENNKINANQIVGLQNTEANGGGILFEELPGLPVTFYIAGNEISNNSASGQLASGVGICVFGGSSTITGNIIENNVGTSVTNAMGGGIRLLSMTGEAYVTNNEIRNNIMTSESSQGGGIDVGLAVKKVYIQDNTIKNNSLTSSYASWGGGISFILDNELLVENNHVSNNYIQGNQFSAGPGIYSERASGLVEFKNNYFSNNYGAGTSLGGGIAYHNTFQNPVVFDGNTFEYNEARIGGGIWTFNSYDMVVSNNVFRKNTALMNGGGIFLRYNPGDNMEFASAEPTNGEDYLSTKPVKLAGEHPLVINNSFVENDAVWGGGFYSEHLAEFPLVINSIFSNNTADRGQEIYNSSIDTILISYCNLDTTSDSSIYGKWSGYYNIFEDPGFCDSTCHIDQYSPCANAGVDSLEFLSVWYYAPIVDFEGDVRPYGEGIVDIGADECDIYSKVPDLGFTNEKLRVKSYPNPFRDQATIEFNLPEGQQVSLEIFDLMGREIQTLVSGWLEQGEHTYTLNAGGQCSRIYFYRLTAGDEMVTGKLVVAK